MHDEGSGLRDEANELMLIVNVELIAHRQPSFFATLPHDLANFLGVVDFGHCTTVVTPAGKKRATANSSLP